MIYFYCFFNVPATTEIYTLSLHDALPISPRRRTRRARAARPALARALPRAPAAPLPSRCGSESPPPCATRPRAAERSEEHTSELQSRQYLVCRLLLEKKNNHVCSITADIV